MAQHAEKSFSFFSVTAAQHWHAKASPLCLKAVPATEPGLSSNQQYTSQPSTPASGAIKQPHTCAPWFALVDLEGVVAALLPLLTISWP
jgi:hypothetical protein